ncbi:MAG: YHS domain-containing (seleno)protein [Ignavibacteria bacterium]|nr:YHS domain-containing (seleno)protein [Ignavibacteria bacterium]
MKHSVSKSIIGIVIALSFVFSIQAQDQKSKKENVELGGSCPVAYLMMGKDIKGDAKFASTFENKTYNFANADAKKMFDADPKKYLPKYNGYCATGIAMGEKIVSDHQYYSIYDGSTYLFSNKMAKETFDKNPKTTIKNADKNFAALTK